MEEKQIKKLFIEHLNNVYPRWKEDMPKGCWSNFPDDMKETDCFNWVKTVEFFKHFQAGYLANKKQKS